MTDSERVHVVRRWGFWCEDRLVLAGMAIKSDPTTVSARLAETPHYRATLPLPRRLELEEGIRKRIARDVHDALGPGCRLSIQFEPGLRDEQALLREVLGSQIPHEAHQQP